MLIDAEICSIFGNPRNVGGYSINHGLKLVVGEVKVAPCMVKVLLNALLAREVGKEIERKQRRKGKLFAR